MFKAESGGKKIVISLVSISVFFFLAEAALFISGFDKRGYSNKERVFYNNPGKRIGKIVPKNQRRCSVDPLLFWKLNPLPGEVNSSGFRSKKEYSINKREGEKRIICLGDSITYGTWVKTEETYPYVLEEMLNNGSGSGEFEVINAGVMGYSSLQGLRRLKRDLIKYKPDLIIAYFGFDDNFPAVIYNDKEQKTYNKLIFFLDNSLSKTRLYCFLKDWLFRVKNLLIAKRVNFREKTGGEAKRRVEPEDYRQNLLEMAKIAKENNSRILFITPVIFKLKEKETKYFWDYQQAIPREYAVDPLGVLKQYEKEKTLFLDGCHFAPAGHWVVAKAIYDDLVSKKIANPGEGVVGIPMPAYTKNYLPEEIREGNLKEYIKMGENEVGALTFGWHELEKIQDRYARFVIGFNANGYLRNISLEEEEKALIMGVFSYIANKASVFINDNYVGMFECVPGQWQEVEFKFKDNSKFLKITISPQKAFKPSIEFGTRDDRTLSLAISNIEVRENNTQPLNTSQQ